MLVQEVLIRMIETVAGLGVSYVQNTKGTPETMNAQTGYEDILKEMLDYFIGKS
jgi:dihydropteroate synthase